MFRKLAIALAASTIALGVVSTPTGALAVNRRSIGTPHRHPKGTPLSCVLSD